MYRQVAHHKTISITRATDSIINKSINFPRRSLKGLFLLLYEPNTSGTRDSENSLDPNISEVKVVMNEILNESVSQGKKTRDLREKFAQSLLETVGQRINQILLWREIYPFDLKILKNNDLHSSGFRLMNTWKRRSSAHHQENYIRYK